MAAGIRRLAARQLSIRRNDCNGAESYKSKPGFTQVENLETIIQDT